MTQGGYGKVRFGLDEANRRVAIKMLRMRPKAKSKNIMQGRVTHVTTP